MEDSVAKELNDVRRQISELEKRHRELLITRYENIALENYKHFPCLQSLISILIKDRMPDELRLLLSNVENDFRLSSDIIDAEMTIRSKVIIMNMYREFMRGRDIRGKLTNNFKVEGKKTKIQQVNLYDSYVDALYRQTLRDADIGLPSKKWPKRVRNLVLGKK